MYKFIQNIYKKNTSLLTILSCLSLGLLPSSHASAAALEDLQQGWVKANYNDNEDAQELAFTRLITEAEQAIAQQPKNAELLIWQGIILSSFAGKAGGLNALKYVKAAKVSLEKSIEIDDSALNGSAYTSLGALYYQVPGWPIAFGSDKKAKKFLKKAISINGKGIDSNYFYADFLISEKDYDLARTHLDLALNAAPRPERAQADIERRKEVKALLESIENK